MTSTQIMDTACEMISAQTGLAIEVTAEDRLAAAVIEAMMWLEQNAPSRALETLRFAHAHHTVTKTLQRT